MLCDCGGSNNYRSHAFKHYLQVLADDLGLSIHVADYPIHCSKYNPIEHRLFCHIERSFSCRLLQSASETATSHHLMVTTATLPPYPPIGCRLTFTTPPRTQFDPALPDYNYTLPPQQKPQ